MANSNGLIEFVDYLQSGDKSARAQIKAADLDENFRKLSLINPDGKPIFQMTSEGVTFQTIDIQVCVNGVTKTVTVLGFGPY
jgi:hypothetical protein